RPRPRQTPGSVDGDHGAAARDSRRLSCDRHGQQRRHQQVDRLPRDGVDGDALGLDRSRDRRRRRPRTHPRLLALRAAMTAIIETESLTKRYRDLIAVNGLSFTVDEGEIFGFLGPNGAGKTTTILMLLGLTEPSGGRVRVCGFDPAREALEVKKRVGYLPENPGFYDDLSGKENLRQMPRLNRIAAAEPDHR